MKRIISGLICTIILVCFSSVYVSALSIGHYTGYAQTYYINPDTGVTDDGGSRNEAVGEGMCRSVIAETALVEYDGADTYVTLRVLLLSNIRDLKLYVQQTKGDANSYTQISPEIMSEDAENDCADYRFKVPQSDSYIKCSAYIIPMSRDVTFYINVSGELSEGAADFIVSVEKKETNQVTNDTSESNSITVNVSEQSAKNDTAQNHTVSSNTKTSAASNSTNTQKATPKLNTAAVSDLQNVAATESVQTSETPVNSEQPTEGVTEQPKSTEQTEKDDKLKHINSNNSTDKTKKSNAGTITAVIVIIPVFAAALVAGIRHFKSR